MGQLFYGSHFTVSHRRYISFCMDMFVHAYSCTYICIHMNTFSIYTVLTTMPFLHHASALVADFDGSITMFSVWNSSLSDATIRDLSKSCLYDDTGASFQWHMALHTSSVNMITQIPTTCDGNHQLHFLLARIVQHMQP